LVKLLRIAFSTSARRCENFELGFNAQKTSRIEGAKSRDGRRLTPQQQRRNETWRKFMETANLDVIKNKTPVIKTILPKKWAVRSQESSAITVAEREEFLTALDAASTKVILPNPLYTKDLLFGHERPKPVRASKKKEKEVEEDKSKVKFINLSKEYEESIAKAEAEAKVKAEAEAEAQREQKKLEKLHKHRNPEPKTIAYPLLEDVGLLGLARYSKLPKDISKLINELFPVPEPPPERTPRSLPWMDMEIMDELEAIEIKQRAHDQLRTPSILISPHIISTAIEANMSKLVSKPRWKSFSQSQSQSLSESEEEVLTLVNVGTTLLPSDIKRAIDVSSDYTLGLNNLLNSITQGKYSSFLRCSIVRFSSSIL